MKSFEPQQLCGPQLRKVRFEKGFQALVLEGRGSAPSACEFWPSIWSCHRASCLLDAPVALDGPQARLGHVSAAARFTRTIGVHDLEHDWDVEKCVEQGFSFITPSSTAHLAYVLNRCLRTERVLSFRNVWKSLQLGAAQLGAAQCVAQRESDMPLATVPVSF